MKNIIFKECPKHGITEHVLTNGAYKCKECRKKAVIDTRKKNKIKLVEYKGGKCEICGYDKCIDALEFHHLNPQEKEFGISCGNTLKFETLKKEADKCILVCANCHREIHSKIKEEVKNRNKKETENEINYFSLHKEKRKNKTFVNGIDINSIKNDIVNNLTKKEISKKYLISISTLNRLLKRNDIKYQKQNNKLSKLSIEYFLELFKTNGSFTSVGKQLNVSDNALKKWCKKNKLPNKKKDLIEYIRVCSTVVVQGTV